MTSILDPEKLQSDLSVFCESRILHGQRLQAVLQDYTKLIEDYRALKSDYEEARESREKYKRIAKEGDRNPFVLVLVDGDGYVFKDQFIRDRSEGGVEAAQELHERIRAHLSTLGNEVARSRIMVRVYANLKGLSQTLSRVGLSGNESRSLAPFACGFTRAQELFDFVDVGEGKERADFKINEMFRLFVDNPQCKHIFFAGCHDSGYVNTITPYAKSAAERITLIRGSYFSHEFEHLGLQILELQTLFRSKPLENSTYNSNNGVKLNHALRSSSPTITTTKFKTMKKPCPYYPKDKCWHGATCNYAHEPTHIGGGKPITPPESDDLDLSSTSNANFTIDDASIHSETSLKTMAQIPIRKDGSRIDLPLPDISQADMNAYSNRVKLKKLCNDYVLVGYCSKENCPYDHSKGVPKNIVNVLRSIVRSKLQCAKGAPCRSVTCYRAHTKNHDMNSSDRFEYEWVPAEDVVLLD